MTDTTTAQALPYRTVGTRFDQARSREEWLANAASVFAQVLEDAGWDIPDIQWTVGYGPTGFCAGVQGETWAKELSDGTFTIFVAPHVEDVERVLVIVAHELCHAVEGLKRRDHHRGEFTTLADLVGLDAPYTSTPLGQRAKGWYADLARTLGDYRHRTFVPVGRRGQRPQGLPEPRLPEGHRPSSGRPRQKTYMVKVHCEGCGFIARATSRWLKDIGAPSCACGAGEMTVDWPEE